MKDKKKITLSDVGIIVSLIGIIASIILIIVNLINGENFILGLITLLICSSNFITHITEKNKNNKQ